MKQIRIDRTIPVYGIDELPDAVRQRLIEAGRRDAETYAGDLLGDIVPGFVYEQLRAGIVLPSAWDEFRQGVKVYYSLSYSQGDGVALHGQIDRANFPNLPWPDDANRATFTHSGHYYHELSFTVELFNDDDEGGEWLLSPNAPSVVEFTKAIRQVCRDAERYGYADIENTTSAANALEVLRDMGEAFNYDGSLVASWILDGDKVGA